MRIGVFGGSFDPVHNGHLRLAEACHVQAGLDRVRFVPAAAQPLKPRGPNASADDRLAMLRLAIKDLACCELSTIELTRGGMSYTAETLAQMQQQAPSDEFFFLMGVDSLADFGKWRQPNEICKLTTLLVVRRPGTEPPNVEQLTRQIADLGGQLRLQWIDMAETPISSSEIRRQIADGDDAWRDAVPASVAEYIEQKNLYQA